MHLDSYREMISMAGIYLLYTLHNITKWYSCSICKSAVYECVFVYVYLLTLFVQRVETASSSSRSLSLPCMKYACVCTSVNVCLYGCVYVCVLVCVRA